MNHHIVLYTPAIPQNTGSIARLCAATGATLHLIHPLGFDTSAPSVRRAGLDYWPHVKIKEHANWESFLSTQKPETLFFYSKFSMKPYTNAPYTTHSYLVFGNEVSGLPKPLHEKYSESFYTIPIRTELVRSLNLAQCAAVVLFEAIRVTTHVSDYSLPERGAELVDSNIQTLCAVHSPGKAGNSSESFPSDS